MTRPLRAFQVLTTTFVTVAFVSTGCDDGTNGPIRVFPDAAGYHRDTISDVPDSIELFDVLTTDTEAKADSNWFDTVEDSMTPDALLNTDNSVPTDESGFTDLGTTPDTQQVDHGVSDTDATNDGSQMGEFCRSIDDCANDEVCNLTLGRCDSRDSWKTGKPALYSFHPLSGAVGDKIILDGSVFYSSMLSTFSVRADIGGKQIAGGLLNTVSDENRIVGNIVEGANGNVRVVFGDGGGTKTYAGQFTLNSGGVLACDGSTPGRLEAGTTPRMTGPFAAGYVDVDTESTRIFYPAECGSNRRPGVPGEYSTVIILHGNGATHIQYEYLGQLLASWGFVAAMPMTEGNNQWSDEATRQIDSVVDLVRGKADLGSVHPVLSGVSTTNKCAFIGHSRGCGRIEEYFTDYKSSISADFVGAVYLGPAHDNIKIPGAFMVFGGGKDGQSFKTYSESAFERQDTPKWKFWMEGANHSNFCDHKVYYSLDGQPTFTRHEQLAIVQTFVVPFMQRIFGLDEPFAFLLDNPPPHSLYEVEFEL